MAEYGDGERQEEHRNFDENTAENAGPNNNSIIGKMRSSVTSILPNSLSKWFSPSSASNNDATNGSYVASKRPRSESEGNTPHTRVDRRTEMARRRIDVDNYEEDDGDGGGGGDCDGDDLDDEEAAEESNHSDDIRLVNRSANLQHRKHLNMVSPVDQPPSKRSRMTLDGTMFSSQPLIASTPSINAQRDSGNLNNHYSHLNLYAGVNRKELAYDFYNSTHSKNNFEQQNVNPDIIDLIPIPVSTGEHDILNVRKTIQIDSESSSSRRALNIPPSTIKPLGSGFSSSFLPSLKRQSLNTLKANSSDTDFRHNTAISSYDHKNDSIAEDQALELDEVLLETQNYNGSVQPKFQNGAADFEEKQRRRSVTDSDAEETDTIGDLPTDAPVHKILKSGIGSQRVASSGLFNMSFGNSRSGSRTSSFGNGLNFYTHLEGRKSLFSGNISGGRAGNPLNTSTLSLNSLSRRQFNASIYGSTSALSDSRLLNTSSPFYKGNTTYGGASAYSKYATSLCSSTRLTPTLIRPTSSLSTLSSSNNSIVAGAAAQTANEQAPTISGTAKTILDLLNGFTTPLSEAKKMATSMRQQPLSSTTMHNSKSKRLNEEDLQISRAIRLQQVRSPYTRPAVLLQPKKSIHDTPIPPVRELQVPSMSQLLQMKKLQSLTERSRQITMQKSNINECSVATLDVTRNTNATAGNGEKCSVYSLPATAPLEQHHQANIFGNPIGSDCKQQKHVNKIKHKMANPLRAPDIPDESPPIPANLPNIAFPLMSEMPKIDITLPSSKNFCSKPSSTEAKRPKTASLAESESYVDEVNGYKFSPPVEIKELPSSTLGVQPSKLNFEFSKPTLLETGGSAIKAMEESENDGPTKQTPFFVLPKETVPKPTAVPTLKTGSVMEALKKPFVLPKPVSSKSEHQSMNSVVPNSFASQFSKACDEWECDTCMIRNKESVNKCIACETPRKGAVQPTTILQKSLSSSAPKTPFTAGFGDQFKKQAAEWECDTCMVRNKPELDKCVSCETPHKTAVKLGSQTEPPRSFSQTNFNGSVNSISVTNVASDSGFKSLAASQQASKWECEACMTLNESSRSKCACCEQPKPGSESQKENAPSFNFGATAVSKFTFGFSAAAPDPAKANDFRQDVSNTHKGDNKASEPQTGPSKGFTIGAESTAVTSETNSFSFGFQNKSNVASSQKPAEASKDVSDSSNKTPGLNFVFTKPNTLKSNENITKNDLQAINTASTSTAPTLTSVVSTVTSVTTPKVTFSFGNPTTATSTKPQELKLQTMSAENATVNSTTTVTSSTASKLSFPSVGTGSPISQASSTPPKTVSFTNTNSSIVLTSATSTTTTTKPMFSFGTPSLPSSSTGNVSSTVALSTTTTTASVVTNANATSLNSGTVGFNFMNSKANVLAPTSAAANNSQFSLNSNNSSQNSNTFTAFGSTKTNSQPTFMTATTTTTAAPPTFGEFSFGSAKTTTTKIESSNLFGTQTTKAQTESKPTAMAAPFFGNTVSQPEQKTTTSNTWSKPTFHFGSPGGAGTATAGSNESSSKPVFGSIKPETTQSITTAPSNLNTMSSSIFGNVGSSSATPSFGNGGSTSTAIFGAESTVAPTPSANLFGSKNNTSIPQFGIMSGGQSTLSNHSSLNNAPSFGSTAPASFGSFGSAAATAAASSTTKIEPNSSQQTAAPFAFGAPPAQSTSTGFNFGTNNATSKPAFNFSSTNQPTFNFTGGSNNSTQNSTQPFQFGATAAPSFNAPPVFSFGGAPSNETTTNTPFQFNAGSAPATSNIFAPAPTTSATTPTARRKVRLAIRRIPPR